MKAHGTRPRQRGGFLIGFVVGLLIGLAAALGVALYVTKAPNPFVNKVPARSPSQDAAEAERNRSWDPNSALAGRNPAPGTSSSGVVTGLLPVCAERASGRNVPRAVDERLQPLVSRRAASAQAHADVRAALCSRLEELASGGVHADR